jgi:hypothetical protein
MEEEGARSGHKRPARATKNPDGNEDQYFIDDEDEDSKRGRYAKEKDEGYPTKSSVATRKPGGGPSGSSAFGSRSLGHIMHGDGKQWEFLVVPENWKPLFQQCYWATYQAYYKGYAGPSDPIISEDEFITIMNYLLEMRVYAVNRGRSTTKPPTGFIRYDPTTFGPKSLISMINMVGRHYLDGNTFCVWPYLGDHTEDDDLNKSVTASLRTRWIRWIDLLVQANVIRTDTVSRAEEGSCWWTLPVIKPGNYQALATYDDTGVRVASPYNDVSPNEITMAAYACLTFKDEWRDGGATKEQRKAGVDRLKFNRFSYSDIKSDLVAAREKYFLSEGVENIEAKA